MATQRSDGQIVEWGTRVFYGMPKRGKEASNAPLLALGALAFASAGSVRARVRQVIAPGARQVVLKITGGGKGMKAIAAHFRYVSRLGKEEVGGKGKSLELEDDQGMTLSGSDELAALRDEWRYGGSQIPDESHRREAFNIVLSMPGGTPSSIVRDAAREFANETFAGHKFVFALHEDTDAPHVHLVVRAERNDGVRLNPRKPDLAVWRERFAQRLQERGVQAVATRAAVRGRSKAPDELWRVKAAGKRELRKPRSLDLGPGGAAARGQALVAWQGLAQALEQSADPADKALARDVAGYLERQFEVSRGPRSAEERGTGAPTKGRAERGPGDLER